MRTCTVCGRPMFPIALMPDLSIMRACAVCDGIGWWPRSSGVVILPERPFDWETDGI